MISHKNLIENGQTGPVDKENLHSSKETIHEFHEKGLSLHPDSSGTKGEEGLKPSKRCMLDGCRKKLKLVDLSKGNCKCQKMFCSKHYGDHSCSYDYRKEGQDRLKSTLVEVRADRVTKI